MKFYIFGSSSSKINVKPKKAIYSSDNFEDVVKMFDSYVAGIRNTNIWLVVDFECKKQSFWGSNLNKDHFSDLPFFVIAEYHFGKSGINCVRRDTTCIFRKGFHHEFSNNIKALKEFLYFYNKDEYARWTLTYRIGDREFNREIINTIDLRDSKKKKVRKFCLGNNDWETIPLSRNSTEFFNYKIFAEPNIEGEGPKIMDFN